MDDDKLTTCPSCGAEFQVIINAANPACRPLAQGGFREGVFCPCCAYEFDEASSVE